MRKCQMFVPFQKEILTVEVLGGISNDFICFNPGQINGQPDYKIQLTERILLKFEDETQLISVDDYDGEFIIVNSKGEKLTDSLNVNPQFVNQVIDSIIERGGEGIPRKDLN